MGKWRKRTVTKPLSLPILVYLAIQTDNTSYERINTWLVKETLNDGSERALLANEIW
jgi:hypothetical protein